MSALPYAKARNRAADLGCGAMADTRLLLDEGFRLVDAVDSNLPVKRTAEAFPEYGHRLTFAETPLENLRLEASAYDLVNAQFVLPFITPDTFPDVWKMIRQSLSQGGIFAGQFFGPEDDWADRPTMSFHTLDEVHSLLNELEIIKLREVRTDRNTAFGEKKFWHTHHVIAKRK